MTLINREMALVVQGGDRPVHVGPCIAHTADNVHLKPGSVQVQGGGASCSQVM